MAELERAETFTGYHNMDDDQDEIMDEEHWNWPVLITRIFCFFLLFLIIVCVILEVITPRFLILAAIICGFLVLIVVATYIDPRKWYSIICRKRQAADPTPARTIGGTTSQHQGPSENFSATNPLAANRTGASSPRPPPRPSNLTAIPVTVTNPTGAPIQMIERNSVGTSPPTTTTKTTSQNQRSSTNRTNS